MRKPFDGQKATKLGTKANPAEVTVKSEERSKELAEIFEKNGWSHKIKVDADKDEDITNLDILQNPVATVVSEKKVGPNAPCPCGSGKKYKKCCGK